MNNQGIEPVHELKRLVFDGISTDIFLAHEAHDIFRAIGERTPNAAASTFQPMLVALQSYASAEFVLAVTRLLERQREKYELHSVHGVLMFLNDNASLIQVQEPQWVQQSMKRLDLWESLPHVPGPEQTHAVVTALLSKLPHHKDSEPLKALKDLRDKRIAHPERERSEGIATTTWEQALKLLEIPLEALSVCGAYISTAYVDGSGQYIMQTDAARAGNATRRLLEAAQTPRGLEEREPPARGSQ
jgi:hypothetical protein